MEQSRVKLLKKSLIVVILILMFALTGVMLISTQVKTVLFNYYGTEQKIITLADSIDSFLIQNKTYIEENSNIYPSRECVIENGMSISITSNDEIEPFTDV